MATPFGQSGSSGPGTPFGQSSGSARNKSVRPKNVNKNIKVSQSEINTIKKMGMKKALASAGSSSASLQEGIRRLYGERRYQAAVNKPTGVSMGKVSNFNYAGPNNRTTPAFTYTGPNNRTTSNFTYSAPKADKRSTRKADLVANPKKKNVAGFKPGSIGAKAISSFRKAYSPQSTKKSK
jgi:hypothetical protein